MIMTTIRTLAPRAAAALAVAVLLGLSLATVPPARAAEPALIEPTLGDDGLYHHDFFMQSFLDLQEDLAETHAADKRLVIIFEQRGCIYCKKVNVEILGDPAIYEYVKGNFNVLQLNLFGEREVTDFDGETMPEKQLARRWGVIFTPTLLFMPEDPADAEGMTGKEAAVFNMHGAFGKHTFLSAFEWVKQKGYEGDTHFQKYVAERLAERRAAEGTQ
ncbi:thioredoxin family protein [uncultured Rhodospira sp.]|uniref:thioredoxin family protein n=1 Tax=uncultured Rhodospira sp. TaxID=1936189 RepID=UPI0026243CC0|nr:thioredoxin family protein [uncultured Rhodospira sp.]